MLIKSQLDFQRYVKKIEAQAKKWFSYKKTCYFKTLQDKTICETPFFVNPFSSNVPFMDKPGSWFLLAKCLKSTCGKVTF